MRRIALQDGFTLIELLVVIATIALFVAMILPALAATRQNSQVTGCLSNQRHLTAAWMMYAGDNQDNLVPNRGQNGQSPLGAMTMNPLTDPDLQPGGKCADWCPGDLAKLGCTTPGNYPGGSRYSWWIEAGLLYPCINNLNVYRCPADHSIVPRSGGPFTAPALRTYSMNCWMEPMDDSAEPYPVKPWNGISGYVTYTKLSDIVKPGPAKTWVFMEENPLLINDGFFALNPAQPTIWYELPGVLHGNASVLTFADGHADSHRWTDQYMINDVNPQGVLPGGNIPADPNSSDLAWLISASTVHK